MRVYVLEVGDYGDNGTYVKGVFSTRQSALLKAPDEMQSPYDIQTFEVDGGEVNE